MVSVVSEGKEIISPKTGLSIARVRLLFALPPVFASYPHPLAYVEWYKPLDTVDPDLGMFETSHDRRRAGGGKWPVRSSIIPVTDIQPT